MENEQQSIEPTKLKRELKVADAAAFSVGLIGPVGVMALLGAGAASMLGGGATWAFIFALIAVALVAFGFVKLSRHISHTGSVYATVGLTLGPRAGFIAGWSLLLGYVTIGAGSGIEIGLFVTQLFKGLGIAFDPDWIGTALVALALVVILGRREVHTITRLLLFAELIGAVLVVILDLVIFFRVGTGTAPSGQAFSWDFLSLPSGTDISIIAGAAVFGFLAFAGFEGAATLGEETSNPKRDIPRAIKIAIVVVGAFYLITIVAQSLGYGLDAAGVKKFGASSAPYADLAGAYVGPWLGHLLTLAAIFSLFAIFVGTMAGAARVLFALARDSGTQTPLTRVSKHGAPTVALTAVAVLALVVMLVIRFTNPAVLDGTFWALTIGTIALLVAYVLATVGAIRFLFFGTVASTPKWQIVVPTLGLVLVFYTLYKNAVGLDAPYSWFPYMVVGWLLIGFVISFRKGLTSSIAGNLAAMNTPATDPREKVNEL